MLALAEPITNTRTPKGPRWTREQAVAAHRKGLEARRKNSEERKRIKAKASELLQAINAADPLTHVEQALAAAAKRGNAKACEHLALAVSRLRRTPEPVTGPASASYTPTHGISQRQPTPATPQPAYVTKHEPVQHGANFAQYTDHLVQADRESPKNQTVGAMPGVGAGPGVGGHGVIESITRTGFSEHELVQALKSLSPDRLKSVLEQVQVSENGTKPVITQTAGGHLRGGAEVFVKPEVGLSGMQKSNITGVQAQEGMEKFCVNGIWVWGKRHM